MFFSAVALRGYDFPEAFASAEPLVTDSDMSVLSMCARRSAATASCLLRCTYKPALASRLEYILCAPAKRRATTTEQDREKGSEYTWNTAKKLPEPEFTRHVEALTLEMDKLTAMGKGERHHAIPRNADPKSIVQSVGVFKLKLHSLHSKGPELKARYCVNGNKRLIERDAWEVTAHVASNAKLKFIIALSASSEWSLIQIDVKSAFTQVRLPEDKCIWLRPLPGFPDTTGKGLFLKLYTHLYGHPEANRAWTEHWVTLVTAFGFIPADRMRTIFFLKRGSAVMRMGTVVDDSILAYNNAPLWEEFKAYLESKLPIAVQELSMLCGLQITRDLAAQTIFLSQAEYIAKKAAKYGWDTDGRTYSTPMAACWQPGELAKNPDPAVVKDARTQVGALLWATITHSSIQYACSRFASLVHAPPATLMAAIKRAGRFLYATRDSGLRFTAKSWTLPDGRVIQPDTLVFFVDASLGRGDGMHSQTGIFALMNGSVVYSKSGRQSQIADSSGKSETIALHEVCHLAVQFAEELTNLGAPPQGPILVLCDNKATVTFAQKGWGKNSLHYDLKLLYIYECQKKGLIKVEFIGTKLQLADVLTKPCPYDVSSALMPFILGGAQKFSCEVVHDDDVVITSPRPAATNSAALTPRPSAPSQPARTAPSIYVGQQRSAPLRPILRMPAAGAMSKMAGTPSQRANTAPQLPGTAAYEQKLRMFRDILALARDTTIPLDDILSGQASLPSRNLALDALRESRVTTRAAARAAAAANQENEPPPLVRVDTSDEDSDDDDAPPAVSSSSSSAGSQSFVHAGQLAERVFVICPSRRFAVVSEILWGRNMLVHVTHDVLEDISTITLDNHEYQVVRQGTLMLKFPPHEHIHGFRCVVVRAQWPVAFLSETDLLSARLPSGARPIMLPQHPALDMEQIMVPLLYDSDDHYRVFAHIVTPQQRLMRLWWPSHTGVPYGPRRSMQTRNDSVCFILDEQFLDDPPGHILGMSYIPTDWVPWLRDTLPEMLPDVVGTLRFRFLGSDDIFETPVTLTTKLCFQLDLVHLTRGVTKCMTRDDPRMEWDPAVGLTVGGVRIPHVVNSRGLKVAQVEVLAPFIAIIPPVSDMSGPTEEGDPAHVLFSVKNIPHALIPLHYNEWLHDVEPAPALRAPFFGCPAFAYGTLRVRFHGGHEIHPLRSALLAGGWNQFYLSYRTVPEHLLAHGHSPSVRATIIPPE